MEILTAKELAKLLKISLPTLYGLIKTGDLKGFRVGSEWRFEQASVEEFVKRNQRTNLPDLPPRAGNLRRHQGKTQ